MAKTWKQLKAEGVKRCSVTYTDGSQCRRKEAANGFCAKHQALQETINLISDHGGNGHD